MKSCASNRGAAYSRPVLASVGSAWEVWLRNRRGGLMERWDYLHCFTLILCASLFLALPARTSSGPFPSAHPQVAGAQTSSQQNDSSQSSTSGGKTSEQA